MRTLRHIRMGGCAALLAALAVLGMLPAACGDAAAPCRTPAEALRTRLQRCVERGVTLFGHQDDLFYGKNWNLRADGEHSDIRAVAGDYPAVLGVEIGGIELGDSLSIDGIPFETIRRGVADHHRRGGIVTVSWHPANPLTGGDSWDVSSPETVVALLPEGSHHRLARTWLGRAADFLASLQDDDGAPIPLIWRPWHENAGGWFWWGAEYTSPEAYRALWGMTRDYLTSERGFDWLVWAYSPGFTDRCATGYTDYYPGDDRVDLIGIDIYQYGTDAEFTELARRQLTELDAFAREHGKLLALTETGCEGIPSPTWWTETLRPAVEGLPLAYVLTWRNAWDRPAHFYAPYEGHASADDFRIFAGSDRIGLLGDLNKLNED